MKGQVHIVYPDKPIEVRLMSHPLDSNELENILGQIGVIDVVSNWEQHLDFGGVMRPALVLWNAEAPMLAQPFNLAATALWQFIAKVTGNPHDNRLTGPVVICMGDQEFLENIIN